MGTGCCREGTVAADLAPTHISKRYPSHSRMGSSTRRGASNLLNTSSMQHADISTSDNSLSTSGGRFMSSSSQSNADEGDSSARREEVGGVGLSYHPLGLRTGSSSTHSHHTDATISPTSSGSRSRRSSVTRRISQLSLSVAAPSGVEDVFHPLPSFTTVPELYHHSVLSHKVLHSFRSESVMWGACNVILVPQTHLTIGGSAAAGGNMNSSIGGGQRSERLPWGPDSNPLDE